MPRAGRPLKALLLAGTREARELRERLVRDRRILLRTSLAGVTRQASFDADHQSGFGGAEGLVRYVDTHQIELIIDATHPFALKITKNASRAAKVTGIAYLRLERPPWLQVEGDRWIEEPTQLPDLGRFVFVTTGIRSFERLPKAPHQRFWLRTVEPSQCNAEIQIRWIQERPPFSLADEIALMSTRRIDALVTKNSGGDGGYTKIEAARRLSLPVVMLQRTAVAVTPISTSVASALGWIEALLERNT